MPSMILLSYCLGSALKSESWVRKSYFDAMVEVEGHIFIHAIFIYDAEVVFAGDWGIAINLFDSISPFINNQRRAIVMVEWDVILIIGCLDPEVERCWFGWIGWAVLRSSLKQDLSLDFRVKLNLIAETLLVMKIVMRSMADSFKLLHIFNFYKIFKRRISIISKMTKEPIKLPFFFCLV